MLENQIPTTPMLIQDLGMIYPYETSTKKRRYGLYKCSCNTEFKSQIYDVKIGKTKSCGCYQKKIASVHNLSSHRLYATWNNIILRTTNENHISYKDYGAIGIKVCERWNDIANFIEDMYPSYQEGLTIDRIDNNLGYSPQNCRWTTKSIQSRNTRVLKSTNTSGYRGVSFNIKIKKWVSSIKVNAKSKYLGCFDTAIEAAKAYDRYVIYNNLEHTINGII